MKVTLEKAAEIKKINRNTLQRRIDRSTLPRYPGPDGTWLVETDDIRPLAGGHTRTMTANLTDEVCDALHSVAARRNIKPAILLRDILTDFVNDPENLPQM